MIYLDVTSAAASPLNMGVQRTVRGIHSILKMRPDVVPIRWDFFRKRYASLSPREQGFLVHPFAAYQKAEGAPGGWNLQHLIPKWRDDWSRSKRLLQPGDILREGNTLLIPDLCWDRRIRAWPQFAKMPGRKIAIFHDAMPLRIPGQADSHDALFAEYVRALAQLDLVICISREVEQDLLSYWKKFGVAPKPTCLITWPIPFEEERPENLPNQSARQVIYVARLKLRKNHLVLLEACESLWSAGESFQLDLIGIADAFTDTRKILRRVRELAARGRPVRWRKHISDMELVAAYRDCSFTAFPSRLEGFGLPIIESLWHGRPVICGRNGAISEVAEGGGCYQIDQNNPVELANAIRLLLSDAALYQRLYMEARTLVFRTWSEYEKDLQSVLTSTSFIRR
jgi:glycosyltransferase involved in cell wall biosynthesis